MNAIEIVAKRPCGDCGGCGTVEGKVACERCHGSGKLMVELSLAELARLLEIELAQSERS